MRLGDKKACPRCGQEFVFKSPNEKFCDNCKKENRLEKVRIRMREYYERKHPRQQ